MPGMTRREFVESKPIVRSLVDLLGPGYTGAVMRTPEFLCGNSVVVSTAKKES